MDEAMLLEKLRKIEALHAGATTEGERDAARDAAERIRARLAQQRRREPDIVVQYLLPDRWKHRLFVALCRRYGLEPFRRSRQRYTTVMVRAPRSFLEDTLWPEYLAFADELDTHLSEVTERIVRGAVHDDAGEVAEVDDTRGLPGS